MTKCLCGCGRAFPGRKNKRYWNAKCEAKERARRAKARMAGEEGPLSEEARNAIDMAPIREREATLQAMAEDAASRMDGARSSSLLLQCLGVAT